MQIPCYISYRLFLIEWLTRKLRVSTDNDRDRDSAFNCPLAVSKLGLLTDELRLWLLFLQS